MALLAAMAPAARTANVGNVGNVAEAAGTALSGAAVSGADPGPASLPGDPAAPNELYLEVILNAEATGLILRFTQQGKGLLSSVENLQQLGLDPARFGAPGQAEVALDSIPGLSYDYDAARQSLSLRVDDSLRAPFMVSARSSSRPPPARVTPAAGPGHARRRAQLRSVCRAGPDAPHGPVP